MNHTYTITSKGQITLPKLLRDTIGLRAGGQASISLLDDRTIAIKAPLPISVIRQAIGKPLDDQPLTAKERQKLAIRGFQDEL